MTWVGLIERKLRPGDRLAGLGLRQFFGFLWVA